MIRIDECLTLIDGLAPGRYRVTVSADSFEPVSREVRIAPRRSARMEVDLAAAAVRSEVTVSGARPADLRRDRHHDIARSRHKKIEDAAPRLDGALSWET